jgi:hypothetical protein
MREALDLFAVVVAAMALGAVLERLRARQGAYEASLETVFGILLVVISAAMGSAARLLGADAQVTRTLAVGRLVLLLPALWLLVRGAFMRGRHTTSD